MSKNYGVLSCVFYEDKDNELVGGKTFNYFDYNHNLENFNKDNNTDINIDLVDFSGSGHNEDVYFRTHSIDNEHIKNVKTLGICSYNKYYFDNLNFFSSLKSLRCLDLVDCELKSLNGIEALENLEYLYLMYCKLEDLTYLDKMTKLKSLEISHNENKINDTSQLQYLTKLEELLCNNSNISNLDSISELINLKTLNCSDNQIFVLDSLINLINLEEVNCINNEIQDVIFIENLTKLKKLCISGNPINYLDVEYNTELEHLECGYTGISEIENIANCKKLKYLDVRELYLDTLSGIEECIELKAIRIVDINKPDKSFVDLEIPQIIKDYKTNNCDINLELDRFLDVINRLQKKS